MKRFLLICLTAMFAVASWAYNFSDGGFYYNIVSTDEMTCEVTSGDNAYTGDIVIPSTANGYTVVGIGSNAFNGCTGVTSLIVPSTVTSVGFSAFAGCTSLATVTFEEGEAALEFITDGVFDTPFANCPVTTLYMGRQYSSSGGKTYATFRTLDKLETLTLGQYVTELELCAFHDCSNLKELVIEDATTTLFFNTAWWDLDEDEEYHDDGEPGNDETEPFYKSPLATVYMGRNINYTCSGNNSAYRSPFRSTTVQNALTSITFGQNVTTLPEGLLNGCSLITEIVLPDGVTSIGNSAFYGTGLTEMTIADNITSLGTGVFSRCTSLVSATIGNGVSSLPNDTFYMCSKLETVSLGENIASVGNRAFYQCKALQSITSLNHNPPTVTYTDTSSSNCPFYQVEVGDVTLYVPTGAAEDYEGNEMWKQFNIQEIVEEKTQFDVDGIYYKVLETENDVNEVEVTYGGETATSGTEAYAGNITIPATVNYNNTLYTVIGIGDNAFRNCEGLESVTIAEENITYIGENAFRESGIKTVSLGAVETIKQYAFSESGLTSLSIPDNVTTIESHAFDTCTSMTSLTIGKGLKVINEYVFGYCDIASLVIPDNVEEIGDYAFYRCMQMKSIEIGSGLKTIGAYAFYWSGLTELTIPSTVSSVGNYAFSDNLSLVTVNVDAETIGMYAFYGAAMYELNIGDNVQTMGRNAFDFCANITSLYIPSKVDISATQMFQYCLSLTTVVFEEGRTTCGPEPFQYCRSLTDVTLPESFTRVPIWMFKECTSLKTITLPANVEYIESSAFENVPLEEIYSYNPVPPTLAYESIFKDVYDTCVLYVPVGTYKTYSTTQYWQNFTHIVEMTEFAIETLDATDVTDTTATLNGSITAAFNDPITERGFEYWTGGDEDVQTVVVDTEENGELSVELTDLAYGTDYTYRAYAITESGDTNYGEELTFTTELYAPAIETLYATDVAETSAVLNGTVEQGSEPITSKGFVYWDGDPNVITTIIISDEDMEMSYTLSSLTPETTYTYRAFAVTASGTSYGDDVEFTTLEDTTTGINGISIDDENVEGIYSTSGQKLNTTVKGVNIIRYADGTVKKIYVK